MFLAFSNPLQPIVDALIQVIIALNGVIHNLGWSLIVLAALIRIAFLPLTFVQFKSMAEMQKIAPLLKGIQAKHKGDPQKINAETMALYKEHNVNPFASCLPLLLQMPILFSLYYAIIAEQKTFTNEKWLWIGGAFSHQFPNILATSLAAPDYVLLVLYVVSMYFSVRFGSPPSSDPQQAQTQKIMAFTSPLFIAWFGRSWPSALILYWLAINAFTMAQQYFMLRRFRVAPAPAGAPALESANAADPSRNGAPASGVRKEPSRRKRRSRR
ncbi:MAG TPA: YidC/Oxa1 family membrane protein insertase [Candidatus Binatia bacterium]|nr:YidC/Oxa1 family membrane protein insertase [Candidatus Binatia bacterium]